MSLLDSAARTLREWRAPSGARQGEQERLRLAYLEHLASHPDGVWKSCADGHLTASALIIDPTRSRVLLTLHRKLEMWLQTGGHCEPEDTTLVEAALREATEESGLGDLKPLRDEPVRLDRHRTPCAWHLDVQYALLAPGGATEVVSAESLDLGWYGYDEVAGVADTSVSRLVEGARALL